MEEIISELNTLNQLLSLENKHLKADKSTLRQEKTDLYNTTILLKHSVTEWKVKYEELRREYKEVGRKYREVCEREEEKERRREKEKEKEGWEFYNGNRKKEVISPRKKDGSNNRSDSITIDQLNQSNNSNSHSYNNNSYNEKKDSLKAVSEMSAISYLNNDEITRLTKTNIDLTRQCDVLSSKLSANEKLMQLKENDYKAEVMILKSEMEQSRSIMRSLESKIEENESKYLSEISKLKIEYHDLLLSNTNMTVNIDQENRMIESSKNNSFKETSFLEDKINLKILPDSINNNLEKEKQEDTNQFNSYNFESELLKMANSYADSIKKLQSDAKLKYDSDLDSYIEVVELLKAQNRNEIAMLIDSTENMRQDYIQTINDLEYKLQSQGRWSSDSIDPFALLCNYNITSIPYVQVDESVESCTLCVTKFTLLKRRHHCRSCGFVVCGDCSTNKSTVLWSENGDGDNNTLHRCCNLCIIKIKYIRNKAV